MDLYAENILDHYRNPRGKGDLKDSTVSHEEVNHSCGDALSVQLLIKDGVVEELGWQGTGCAISQAGMSLLAEELAGKSTEEAEEMTPDQMRELLGVPIGPRRVKCALLGLHTVKNAIRKSRGEKVQGWIDLL